MADVPNDLVLGRREDIVQGDGQFDDAEARRDVAAVARAYFDDAGAQLARERGQLGARRRLDVLGAENAIQHAVGGSSTPAPRRPAPVRLYSTPRRRYNELACGSRRSRRRTPRAAATSSRCAS